MWPRKWVSTTVSTGTPTAATMKPAPTRRRDIGDRRYGAEVDDADAAASRCSWGDPRGTPDQRLGPGGARQRDHDALAGLPGRADAMPLAVLLEPDIDLVGEPQQRQLPER